MLLGLGDFDLDKRYYLAGPMSGYEEYNYPAFDEAAHELRESGIIILSPHEVPWPKDKDKMSEAELWAYMMDETFKLVSASDGIILLRGWPSSKGATIELQYFIDQKLPVYYYDDFKLLDMNRRAA